MNKVLFTLCVVLALLFGLALWRLDYITDVKNKINVEKELCLTEKKTCLNEKEEYKNAQISSGKLIKELRSNGIKSSANVDCGDVALPEYVVRVFDKLK